MFENSHFFVAVRNSEIVGSVKVTRWNESMVLPIQKLFHIDPSIFRKLGVKSIWHIGRFAISKSEKEGAKLLRKLIAFAIYPICIATKSLMLAECDSKFVKGLNLLGLKTDVLAPGINYLGSETLPVCSTHESLFCYLKNSLYFAEAASFYGQIETTGEIENRFAEKHLAKMNAGDSQHMAKEIQLRPDHNRILPESCWMMGA